MTSCAAPSAEARRWDALALAVIALGTLLRTLGIGSEALWFDEVMSVEHLAGSHWQDVKGVLTRVDPPLYYAFLWLWIPLAGTSELALRLPSLLCGVAALVLIWRCGRAWFSPAVGAAAAALLAASPLAILYAQEARFYEPLLLCGLAACAAWDRLLLREGGRRELWLYALAAAALFYLHFMGVLLVAAHALFLVVGGLSREARRRGLRALVTAALLIGPYLLGVLYLYLGERAG
ncbi:MAG: glycosyltransferase family 39 protein, partial [Planctomycetes bacterium]|nr:glycosyltransferase family 39 protein [Planctomycetota bacterium]